MAYLCHSIIFRAFQGVGGGGCFSLCTILTIELVPPEKYTQYVTGISVSVTLALLLGPIAGGAVAANTDWRWIFIIKYASTELLTSVLYSAHTYLPLVQ